jgi:ribosomal-protein-alanine N-acetyltransferase
MALAGEFENRSILRSVIEVPGNSVSLMELEIENAPEYFMLVDYDRSHLSRFGDNTSAKYPTIQSVYESIAYPDLDDLDQLNKIRYGIFEEGIMVGSINIQTISDDVAEIGYFVGGQYIKKGYASRALALLTDHAFLNFEYSEIEAHVAIGNDPSRMTVEKCGYELKAIQKMYDPSGQLRDYWILSKFSC